MSHPTFTRSHLSSALSGSLNIKRQQAMKIVDSVFDEIARGLVQEGRVKISSLGTFHTRQKTQRVGRNPKTGEEAIITPRKSLSFHASNILKNCLKTASFPIK